jgi:hypothetical protein
MFSTDGMIPFTGKEDEIEDDTIGEEGEEEPVTEEEEAEEE